MRIMSALIAVLALFLAGYYGAQAGLQTLFGVVLPYVAFVLFVGGVAYKVIGWAKIPVPFNIPTTCGQQRALGWIPHAKYDAPNTKWEIFVRMALEVLFFRSLFRNTRTELRVIDGQPKLGYASTKWLWVAGLAFHYSFLVILLRHLRLFVEPTPTFVLWIQQLDGFLQIGVPVIYVTSWAFLGAVTFLFIRRVLIPQVRYISLMTDYFPLFLLLGIGLTGVTMRHFVKTDIVGVKELAVGLMSLSPTVPEGIHPFFFAHLFLVSVLLAYFPFSKLTHMAGVFLSPTRNLANNSREVRHINPWNPTDLPSYSYEQYEDDWRDKMKAVGIPVEKE